MGRTKKEKEILALNNNLEEPKMERENGDYFTEEDINQSALKFLNLDDTYIRVMVFATTEQMLKAFEWAAKEKGWEADERTILHWASKIRNMDSRIKKYEEDRKEKHP
jgi:hypothetical protein